MLRNLFCYFILLVIFLSKNAFAGTLNCTVSSDCSLGTVIFKMSGTANAHAELPSQSNYTQLVCCSGVIGLSNSCSGTHAVVAKLSGLTNAHIEQNTEFNYTNNVCIGVTTGTVSVGYQSGNCNGYDTTVASISGITNAHVGDASVYTTKICATAVGSSGSVSVDIVDGGGNPVASPAISFSSSNYSWESQQTTGILGTSSQKIRLTSTLADWTLSIAATSGPTALWQSGSNNYDFNGSVNNGRLRVDASGGTILPQSGCSTSGISKGSSTYFVQGSQDSITLLAGNSTQIGCYWDLTGIVMTQDIPSSQNTGNYSIDMTLTAT